MARRTQRLAVLATLALSVCADRPKEKHTGGVQRVIDGGSEIATSMGQTTDDSAGGSEMKPRLLARLLAALLLSAPSAEASALPGSPTLHGPDTRAVPLAFGLPAKPMGSSGILANLRDVLNNLEPLKSATEVERCVEKAEEIGAEETGAALPGGSKLKIQGDPAALRSLVARLINVKYNNGGSTQDLLETEELLEKAQVAYKHFDAGSSEDKENIMNKVSSGLMECLFLGKIDPHKILNGVHAAMGPSKKVD